MARPFRFGAWQSIKRPMGRFLPSIFTLTCRARYPWRRACTHNLGQQGWIKTGASFEPQCFDTRRNLLPSTSNASGVGCFLAKLTFGAWASVEPLLQFG